MSAEIGSDGRSLFFLTIPPSGRCFVCGGDLPPRPPGKTGRAPVMHLDCRLRRKARAQLQRKVARRAWKDLLPYQRTADRQYVLNRRSRKPKRSRFTREQTCARCGEIFLGGHRAVRCVPCEIEHTREYKRARHLAQREAAKAGGPTRP